MVAADNHRHRSDIKDFSHRRLQIAESLVASAGTHVHIAAVDDDLPLVEEHLVEHRIVKAPQPIGVDGGGIAHRPRRHASPRARTRSQIVGKPENGHVGIARTQVVQTRAQPRLHEGGDARKGQIEEVAGAVVKEVLEYRSSKAMMPSLSARRHRQRARSHLTGQGRPTHPSLPEEPVPDGAKADPLIEPAPL